MAQITYEQLVEKFALACILEAMKSKGIRSFMRDIGVYLKAQGVKEHDPECQPLFATLYEKSLDLAKKMIREDLKGKGRSE